MDLAAMLQQGGGAPPQGGPGPMPGGPMPGQMQGPGGPMPPQAAIQVLQKFGITERDLPIIAQAIMTLMQGGGAGGSPSPPQGGPPPMPMPPQ
jgi:hypothetical protein